MTAPEGKALAVVAWAHEWTHSGEESGMRLYDDERHCILDAESDGGICSPLVRLADANAAIAALHAQVRALEADAQRSLEERIAMALDQAPMEVDAKRYRWLRQRLLAADFEWGDPPTSVLVFEWPGNVAVGGNCDKNVDAAMGKEPTSGMHDMTASEMASELRALADEMLRIGVALDYYGGLNPIGDHGRELVRAGGIARGWAAGIEEEETST